MAVETSAVNIVVNVTDANSAAAIGGVIKNIDQLGAAGLRSGEQVTAGMNRGGAAAREMGGHFQTSLDSVRLLRQELGIRVPRSMETMISRNEVLMAGITKLSGLMAGVGFGMIGVALFEEAARGARELWQNYLSLNSAADEYQKTLEKTRDDEFGNSRDIETTTMRIREATAAAKGFRAEAEATNRAGWGAIVSGITMGNMQGAASGVGMLYGAHQEAGAAVKGQGQTATLTPAQIEQQHELNVLKIQADHQNDELGRKLAENQDNFNRDRELNKAEVALGTANPEAPDAGKQKLALENQLARQEAAKGDGDAKSRAQELARIHEEGIEAGMRGSALYHRQEAAAEEDLKRRGLATPQAIDDVRAKFHGEQMKRLEDEQRETEKLGREAGMAGMTGIAKTRAEGEDRIASLDPNLDPTERDKRIHFINQQTNAQIAADQRSLADEVKGIVDASAAHQISEFERIRAEGSRRLDELKKKIRETYGEAPKIGPASVDQQAGAHIFRQGSSQIGADTQDQLGQARRHMYEETEELESQARVKFYDAEKQKTLAIQDEYRERLLKLHEWEEQELASNKLTADERASIEENYNRRVIAAGQQANAEMVEASTAAREKMAHQFDELFEGLNHPMKMLEKLGDKVAGEAAASLVQHFQQRGQGAAGAQQSTGVGVLDDVLGGFGIHRKNAGAPGSAQPGAAGDAHAGHAVAEATFSVSHATINIDGGSFGGGGSFAPGGGGYSGGGTAAGSSWSAPGASTGLFTPGTSGATGGFHGSPSFAGAAHSFFDGTGSVAPSFTRSVGAPSGGGSATVGNGAGFDISGSAGTRIAPGGAGDSGGSGSTGNFAAGSGGPVPERQNVVGTALNDVSQGTALVKQGAQIFGAGGDTGGSSGDGGGYSNGDGVGEGGIVNEGYGSNGKLTLGGVGSQTSASGGSSANGGMLGGGGIGANAGGAIGGALGMYSAVEGTGGVGGAMKGAMSGMELGMALGGPVGAAIGVAAGAVIGAIGFGGREQARVYDLKTVRPKLLSDQDAYAQGGMSYTDAYSDAQQMIGTSWKTTKAMGPAAESYWGDTIKPELLDAMGKFTAEEKAGRSMYSAQSQSFGSGTDNVEATGMNLNHANERIFSPVENSDIIKAVNGSGGGTAQAQPSNSGWSGDLHVHAIDAAGVAQFFDQHKHLMRGSLNQSYAENSGGGL